PLNRLQRSYFLRTALTSSRRMTAKHQVPKSKSRTNPNSRNPKVKGGRASQEESLVFSEDRANLQEKIGLEESFVSAVVRPDAEQARAVTVAKPIGNLLDGGLFEVVGERGLSGVRRTAGQNVSSAIGDASDRGVDS